MMEERCPTNEDDGFQPAEAYAQGKLQAIELGTVDDGTERCAINLKLVGVESEDDAHSILMMRNDSTDWSYSTTLRESALPANVRYQLEYD
jgi:type IV pilus assembly protein PilA